MKKTLSILLALAMVLSLYCLPALADDTEVTTDYALQIYTQTGENGTAVLAKSYTANDLAALKESGTAGYLYYKSDAWQCVAVTEYVTLESLFADAGVSFESGDTLEFTCSDGVYTKAVPSYDDIAAGKYYIDESGSTEVPAALAVTWVQGSLDGTTLDALAETATDTGSLRFVYGITEEEYTGLSAAGSRLPSDVLSISVVSPGFDDVADPSAWYYDGVYAAYDAGLVAGMSDSTFGLTDELTWAQAITFAVRVQQYNASETPTRRPTRPATTGMTSTLTMRSPTASSAPSPMIPTPSSLAATPPSSSQRPWERRTAKAATSRISSARTTPATGPSMPCTTPASSTGRTRGRSSPPLPSSGRRLPRLSTV
jgi:hypothetical protein